MSIFTGIFYFIILAGILVFIHEGGHFLAAKLFKVKVLTFSIGMGPKIFGFKKGDTEYIISAIPVGGYVKLFGDDPSEEPPPEEISSSMLGISPYKKAIIYIAGPAMNLIFPIFLYFFMFLNQNMVPPAEIGMIIDNSPAQKAELQPGDIVTKINGDSIYSWNHMVEKISSMPGKKIELKINRDGKSVTKFITPDSITGSKYNIPILSHLKDKKGQIGIVGVYANTIVGVQYNSPAYKSGLSTFDKILTVNGKKVSKLIDIEKELKKNRGKEVLFTANSLKNHLSKKLFPNSIEAESIKLEKQPALFQDSIKKIKLVVPENFNRAKDIGISDNSEFILHVDSNGPASKAGLKKGDRLIAVDGKKGSSFWILSVISNVSLKLKDTSSHKLTVLREGKKITLDYKADYVLAGTKRDLGLADNRIETGFYLRPFTDKWFGIVPQAVKNPAPVIYSAHMAVVQTVFWSKIIIDVLKSVLTGNISPKSFSGPIGIAHAAAQVGSEGISAFISFMGFISLNLGLMNLLLPIPVLDGGRLVLVAGEIIMRRRLSAKIQEKIMLVGAVMILMLMVWAVIMDITRIFVS